MPFKNYRPHGLKPLSLGKRFSDYKEIYDKKHRLFCQRFIDTILINYMDNIIDLSLRYQLDSNLLIYGIWETDMLLWKIRDLIDTCMEYKYVESLIKNSMVQTALEDFMIELRDECHMVVHANQEVLE